MSHNAGTGSPDVLVLGSANADLLLRMARLPSAGETVLAEHEPVVQAGGKGANQAVAAALAGGRVAFAGCVGDDDNGALVQRALRHAGVDVSLIRVEPGHSTGLAVVMVAADGENAIAVCSGANSLVSEADVDRLFDRVAQADVLLMQLELPLPVVVRATEAAFAAGTRAVLNAAPATALPLGTLEKLDMLIVNRTEAEHLLRRPISTRGDLLHAAVELRERGPASIVVTAGADGLVVASVDQTTHIPAYDVEVVDTSGAGDAFAGVMAVEICRSPVHVAAARAAAAGAATVQVRGAQMTPEVLAAAARLRGKAPCA